MDDVDEENRGEGLQTCESRWLTCIFSLAESANTRLVSSENTVSTSADNASVRRAQISVSSRYVTNKHLCLINLSPYTVWSLEKCED